MIEINENDIISHWNIEKYPIPFISIQCNTYNHAHYISDALDSFLSQKTVFPFEIVVHDDASTDHTQDIIKEYAMKYPNIIHPVLERENQFSKGIAHFHSVVYPLMKGKYTAMCEGDDYWTDDHKLQMEVSYLEKHPDCSLVFTAAEYSEQDIIVRNDRHYNNECDIEAEEIISGGGDYCATASLCFPTKLIFIHPKYRLMADIGDYPMQIMLALHGAVHYFPEITCCYRVNSESSWSKSQISDDNKQTKHWKTEISWLKELDVETKNKFSEAISYRITLAYEHLLYFHEAKTSDFLHYYHHCGKYKRKINANKIVAKSFVMHHFPKALDIYYSIKMKRN